MEERTQQPTRKRIEEARRAGDVPRSPLLTWAFVLACVVVAASLGAPLALDRCRAGFDLAMATVRGRSGLGPAELLTAVLATVAEAGIYVLLVAVIAAFAAAFVQVRPLFTLEPLTSPLRVRFGQRWADGASSLVMTGVVLAIGTWFMITHAGDFAALITLDSRALATGAAALLQYAAWLAVCVIGVLGLGDLLWRRARHLRSLRMTRSERRRADREEEGDPIVRAHRRREHSRIATTNDRRD